jgi:hypothetical protein
MYRVTQKTGLIERSEDISEIPYTPASSLQEAKALLKLNRAQGLAALSTIFRSGRLPDPPLNGRYRGELVALDIAPGVTQFFQWLANLWMPWQGKMFDASHTRGDNIFTKDSYLLARLFNPLYRGFTPDGQKTYRAFAFRTYAAPGLFDTDRMVLKIDYDLRGNPALTVRRVLDELAQLDDDLYLGKAHVHWRRPGGAWQTVAYFILARTQK